LTNGLIDLPKGKIKIKNSCLSFSGTNPAKIPLKAIETIEIHQDRILIYDVQDKFVRMDNLELTEQWAFQITEFLKAHLDASQIKIKLKNLIQNS